MTLWSVYHTLFGVFATSTVSYITPMVWYSHFIFYSVASYDMICIVVSHSKQSFGLASAIFLCGSVTELLFLAL